MRIRIELPHNPQGTSQEKGYDRRSGHVYTKRHVRTQRDIYTNLLYHWMYEHKFRAPRWSGPVSVEITFIFSTKERKKWGELKTTKPDADNSAKLLLDVFEELGWFEVGDQQVNPLTVHRFWGEIPEVIINISPMRIIRTEVVT